jgi:hypothetical protein
MLLVVLLDLVQTAQTRFERKNEIFPTAQIRLGRRRGSAQRVEIRRGKARETRKVKSLQSQEGGNAPTAPILQKCERK